MWMDWFEERWPGFLDKRPQWAEAMAKLEDKYGAPMMDAATAEFRLKWTPNDWGIGDRPPTMAEFRAMLGSRPSWVLRIYPHMRQILNAHEPRNDYASLTDQEKAAMADRIKRAVAGVRQETR
jgi:hypothetical protein